MLSDVLLKCHPFKATLSHQLQSALSHANAPHAVVQPAGTQPALRYLKATPLAQQHVGRRYTHVLQANNGTGYFAAIWLSHAMYALVHVLQCVWCHTQTPCSIALA